MTLLVSTPSVLCQPAGRSLQSRCAIGASGSRSHVHEPLVTEVVDGDLVSLCKPVVVAEYGDGVALQEVDRLQLRRDVVAVEQLDHAEAEGAVDEGALDLDVAAGCEPRRQLGEGQYRHQRFPVLGVLAA
jgi:hypothetical protein